MECLSLDQYGEFHRSRKLVLEQNNLKKKRETTQKHVEDWQTMEHSGSPRHAHIHPAMPATFRVTCYLELRPFALNRQICAKPRERRVARGDD